jgi:formate dehydrogenase beta subunit
VDFKDDGVVTVDANMMTGYPGLFAGGDMVPSDRTVTIGVGHGKKAARNIDAWLRGESYVKPPKHIWRPSTSCMSGTTPTPPSVRKAIWTSKVARAVSRKWWPASAKKKRCTRPSAVCPAATATNATAVTARAPRTPSSSWGRASATATITISAPAARCAIEQCPCHAIELIPEPAETTEQAG